MATALPIYSRRLREAREQVGLSQRGLGLAVQMEPTVASSRLNQYEQGKREPDLSTLRLLAKALRAPLAYFYCDDDALALILLTLHQLPARERKQLLVTIGALVETLGRPEER